MNKTQSKNNLKIKILHLVCFFIIYVCSLQLCKQDHNQIRRPRPDQDQGEDCKTNIKTKT